MYRQRTRTGENRFAM